jgi:hypothetical protein
VRLSPLGTSATNWPIVPAPYDRWRWVWSSRWNENLQGKPKYSEKIYHSVTLSTTNPTWPDLGSNPGRRGGKPATNRLSCGTGSRKNTLVAVFWLKVWVDFRNWPQLHWWVTFESPSVSKVDCFSSTLQYHVEVYPIMYFPTFSTNP